MGNVTRNAVVGPDASVEEVGEAVASIGPDYLPLQQTIVANGIDGGFLAACSDLERLGKHIGATELQTFVLVENYRRLMGVAPAAAAGAASSLQSSSGLAAPSKRKRDSAGAAAAFSAAPAAAAAAAGSATKRPKTTATSTAAAGTAKGGRSTPKKAHGTRAAATSAAAAAGVKRKYPASAAAAAGGGGKRRRSVRHRADYDDDDNEGDDRDDSRGGGASGSRRNMKTRQPVEQIELGTGRVVGRYASQLSAAHAMDATSNASISECLRGKRTQAHGFGWRRAVADEDEGEADEDGDDDEDGNSKGAGPTGSRRSKPVQQLELGTDRVIATHASQHAAARAIGVPSTSSSSIGKCARRQRGQAHGFGWRHVDAADGEEEADEDEEEDGGGDTDVDDDADDVAPRPPAAPSAQPAAQPQPKPAPQPPAAQLLQPQPLPLPLPAPRPPQQPAPAAAAAVEGASSSRVVAVSPTDRVVADADREATAVRLFNGMLARRTHQQLSEAAMHSLAVMAADREIHVYNTRDSDAAYLDMDDATLKRAADTFPVRR